MDLKYITHASKSRTNTSCLTVVLTEAEVGLHMHLILESWASSQKNLVPLHMASKVHVNPPSLQNLTVLGTIMKNKIFFPPQRNPLYKSSKENVIHFYDLNYLF